MPALEDWSKRRLNRELRDNGIIYSAERGWTVPRSEAADEVAAVDAVEEAAIGEGHPQNPELTVRRSFAVPRGLTMWDVMAVYEMDQASSTDTPPFGALVRAEVEFSEGRDSFPTDVDIHGNPLLNTAFDPFEGGGTRNAKTRVLTYYIDEPFYDAATAATYDEAVNDDVFETPFGTFQPGEVQCVSIVPEGRFIIGNNRSNVKVRYVFDVRLLAKWPTLPEGVSPFDYRFMDQGPRAFYTDGGGNLAKYQMRDRYSISSASSFRLNGLGNPIDPDNVRADGGGVTPAPQAVGPAGSTTQIGDNAVFVYYEACPRKSFAALALPTSLI